ncbi:MAG TPA: DUF4118 domain-containing protein [Firmicutes bacterium]|nr:DUF4118 domain-containing protein [Bacillota bacterium]
MKKKIKACIPFGKSIFILLLSTLFAFMLAEFHLQVENIFLIYMIAVIIIMIETKSFMIGGISAVFCILAFNFLFTEPRFTFQIDNLNYYVSFFIFLFAIFIAGNLTIRLQKQIQIAQKNEKMTSALYKVSRGLLYQNTPSEICHFTEKHMKEILNVKISILLSHTKEEIPEGAKRYCYENGIPCGKTFPHFATEEEMYFPILSEKQTVGIAIVYPGNHVLHFEEIQFIETVLTQVALAIEHDHFNQLKEQAKLDIEREKLKTNLLRSISHDLRTPLTSIRGGTEFLKENLEILPTTTMRNLLDNMENDISWLIRLIENLLNMTKIQDKTLTIHKKSEIIDDLISEAVSKMIKYKGKHEIIIQPTEQIEFIQVDSHLLVQVFINIIDNAFKHTREDSKIVITTKKRDTRMLIEIADDGGGMDETQLVHIFESFFTTSVGNDLHRGLGLGLAICQTIIQAHSGILTVKNNEKGGLTFLISLPTGDEHINE